MVNELCDIVSHCEMTEFSSRRLSKNVQSYLHQDGCHYYITQPGKGFQFHTRDFLNGFANGYCSITMPTCFMDRMMSDLMQKKQCFHA